MNKIETETVYDPGFQKDADPEDWERFTGIKVFAALGGIAFLLASVFFVKYCVDQGLLTRVVCGWLSAASGMVCLLGATWIKNKNAPAAAEAFCAGAGGLFFLSLALLLKFETEWQTVGFGVEGAALLWLYHRMDLTGLKWWGLGLLALCFARLAFHSVVFDPHPKFSAPIVNVYLFAYFAVIGCLLLAARMLATPHDHIGTVPVRPVLFGMAAILGFLILNIEIADYFSTGATLTFRTAGDLGRDLTYSLSWAAYGLGFLIAGIRFNRRGIRRGGLLVLTLACVKVFLHDLWQLGQLYRVASLFGLAVTLIFSSFLYQRHLRPPSAEPEFGS